MVVDLREACREAASWSKPIAISVNLSPAQIKQGGAELVRTDPLHTSGKRARSSTARGGDHRERAGRRPALLTISILTQLKSLGVRIALDDFGTGYSSLSRLKDFPLDKIKIDRSFTAAIHLNSQSASITQSIIALGHALGLTVLAEGVESEQQLAILIQAQCDQFQGYLLGQPMPIEHYAAFVRPETLYMALRGAV